MTLFKSSLQQCIRPDYVSSKLNFSKFASQSDQPIRNQSSKHTVRKPFSNNRSLSKQSISATKQPSPINSCGMNIRVFARFRPLNRQELQLTNNGFGDMGVNFLSESSVTLEDNTNIIYTFDQVLPPAVTQQQVFELTGRETVRDVLNGYNGTIIAYGQTGSGKTYTMVGQPQDHQLKGIIPRTINEIFGFIAREDTEIEFRLNCSILEIYRENLYDLLSEHKDLKIKQSPVKGVYVQGLASFTISTQKELYDILEVGQQTRRIASTKFNENSSRSHTLFILDVKQILPNKSEKYGRLNLVDLAGSEKVAKTGATGQTLEQAKKINFSLSCLGNVIHALTNKNDYIPYRDSKLTRILSESIGGNYRTSLIVTCSSHSSSFDETVSTLKFATRAKNIKNNCRINLKSTPQEMQKIISQLRNEVVQLKMKIEFGETKRLVGLKNSELEEPHDEAHQTVRNTSRLRMVKNPFHRCSSITSTHIQPHPLLKITEKDKSESIITERPDNFDSGFHLTSLSISSNKTDTDQSREIAKLKNELIHERQLNSNLKEQLSNSNRIASITYREKIQLATKMQRDRLKELCLQLERIVLGHEVTVLQDRSLNCISHATPKKDISSTTNVTASLLNITSKLPENFQSHYEHLFETLRQIMKQAHQTLQYIETNKQNLHEPIAQYFNVCLRQQIDRTHKAHKLTQSIAMKELVREHLFSLQLIQSRNNFSAVIQDAYIQALNRNAHLIDAMDKRLHEQDKQLPTPRIRIREQYSLQQCIDNSEVIRLVDSNIESERKIIKSYEQNYERLRNQISVMQESTRLLEGSIKQYLNRQTSKSPVKLELSSPVKQDTNRINPKTPPKTKDASTRSVSLCKQLLIQNEMSWLQKDSTTVKHRTSSKLLKDSNLDRVIQFRYQQHYA